MKIQNIQALLSNRKNPTLTRLDKEYKKEKKAERLISKFWDDLAKANLKSDSFFNSFDNGYFSRKYFDEATQHSYTLTMNKNGKFIDRKGRPANGRYIYIVGKNSELIALPYDKSLHHSHIANGRKIKGAGFMFFEDGNLKVVDNNSGHYKPSVEQMMDLLSAICQVVPNQVTFVDYSHVKDGVIYKSQVKDLIYIIEKGGTCDDLADIAIQQTYTKQKRPNKNYLHTRWEVVKNTESNLRASLNYRLENNGGSDESAYTDELSDADDYKIRHAGSDSDLDLTPDIDNDSEKNSDEEIVSTTRVGFN
jgi:hypothetical protein